MRGRSFLLVSLPILCIALVVRAYYKGEKIGEQSLRVAAEIRAKETAQERQRAAEQATVDQENQHLATIERYVNTAIVNRSGSDVGTLLFGNPSASLSFDTLLSEAIRRRGANPVSDLFKPAFVGDGRATALFQGDWSMVQELGLSERADALVLGTTEVSYEQSDRYHGLVTAHLNLDLKCLNLVQRGVTRAQTITAEAPGVTREEALASAIRRTEESITSYVDALPLNR